jgi:hypothetical protein
MSKDDQIEFRQTARCLLQIREAAEIPPDAILTPKFRKPQMITLGGLPVKPRILR